MLAIEITLNILPLSGLLLLAFAIGFFIRGGQLTSLKKKIIELEKEMLSNHADILELQREKAHFLRQIKESKIPVIPMNTSKEETDKQQYSDSPLQPKTGSGNQRTTDKPTST